MRCDHEVLTFGAVVKSVSGRDKKRIFLVVGVTEDGIKSRLLVADGRLRQIADLKTKNPRHVRFIARLTDAESDELKACPTDSTVRKILSAYDKAVPLTKHDS